MLDDEDWKASLQKSLMLHLHLLRGVRVSQVRVDAHLTLGWEPYEPRGRQPFPQKYRAGMLGFQCRN